MKFNPTDLVDMIRKNKYMCIFLAVFLLLMTYLSFYDEVLWWDEAEYMSLSANLLEDIFQFRLFEEETALFKAPLLPYILSGIFRFTGVSENVARLMSPLFGVSTLIVLYVLSMKIFKDKSLAFLSVAFLATNPLFIRMNNLILTDVPFLFFTTLSLYFFNRG